MTKLSVNINKIATLRNARGGNTPNLLEFAKKIQMFGAQGITVHPRPDERHIRYSDVYDLLPIVNTEFNIEGNPNEKFIKMVLEIKPTQVTLVPDGVNDITSSSGWNTIKNESFLTEIVGEFQRNNIRTSIFLNPELKFIENLHKIGTDRIELYTEDYAINYKKGNYTRTADTNAPTPEARILPFIFEICWVSKLTDVTAFCAFFSISFLRFSILSE